MTLYNEHDPFAAAWLTWLIEAGEITKGGVDERSITDLRADDVAGHGRVHLFAGIGGWDYALQLAGWPADRPVWTGSCPCQPFSCAGKGKGEADARHLWPEFRRLIAERRPPTIFGEQVAGRLGRGWLSGVRADLEDLGYAVGAADLCAASAGTPHIRQRLFWVAYLPGERFDVGEGAGQGAEAQERRRGDHAPDPSGTARGVQRGLCISPIAWSDFYLLPLADGKTRRVGSGLFPLAHGVSCRVGRLRGYGNAIVPQVAAVFVRAFLDAEISLTKEVN